MSTKLQIFVFLIVSTVAALAGYLILQSDLKPSDTGDMLVRLGDALFYAFGALALVFFFLLFVPRAYAAWKKFAVWYIPVAFVIFLAYREPGGGDFISPYPEEVYRWISALYVLVSVFVIGRVLLRERKQP